MAVGTNGKRARWRLVVTVSALAVVLGVLSPIATSTPASAGPVECASPEPDTPMFITAGCVDPRFDEPYIDIDEQRTSPVPHRYVHGGFTGTDARFSFAFPPAEQYDGRFFQPTHQLTFSENAPANTIAFGIDSGAYVVQTNMGGSEYPRTAEGALSGNFDPAIGGYRVNAAAAKFSREVAAEMYGDHRTYGYLYGGSGGAYQTITGAEQTKGVWDGVVPFVMGTPNAIPNVFTVRIHALRILLDKMPQIMDAIDPGGSGDPYAGLDEEEAAALEEATRLGFPPRGWWNYATLTGGPLALVASYVPILDPTYVEDFWSEPGYLGTDPSSSVAAARIQHEATVTSVITGPPRQLVLSSVPAGNLLGADLVVTSGAAAGNTVPLGTVSGNTVGFGFGANPAVTNAIQAGDAVRIDNSMYLALQTYHRHQVPTPDMYGWDQFRDEAGDPIYPQRDLLVGPIGAFNASGSIATGEFNGKMIVVQTLMDIDAFPWQADWYRQQVEANNRNLDKRFRLYYVDHAQHGSPTSPAAHARTVSYQGVLERALRDLSRWVEDKQPPPASTSYGVDDAQIEVPGNALLRRGVQATVDLTANLGERADIAVGDTVSFTALVTVPPGAGKVTAAEWDFLGAGTYPVVEELARFKRTVLLRATYTYDAPGTYFPVLRVTSQRGPEGGTPFARVQNIDRVRVVVT